MGIKNFYITSKLEAWLVATYQLGNNFKAYVEREKLTPQAELTCEQAMELLKTIVEFDALNMQLRRAACYVQDNQEIGSPNTQNTITSINQAFVYIEKILCAPYEQKARQTLETYIENKKNERKKFGLEGEIVVDTAPGREQLIERLLQTAPSAIDGRITARLRWKSAIAEVIERNRAKRESWQVLHQTVENYYERVDEEVKNQIRTLVSQQHQQLMKQHEAFMTWLDLYESAMIQSESGMKKLFASIDVSENRKAEIMRTLLRVGISAAITPLIFNIMDPTLLALGGVIKKLAMSKGEIELEASQQNMLFQLTGFMPDANKKTYKEAYEKLSNETMYDSITRYKKYLNHKINSLSEINELDEMMSDKSHLWNQHTPDEIIRAHRNKVMDDGHYRKTALSNPENENNLILEMTKDFESMVSRVFTPLQDQYGSSESLQGMHKFIDQILFDSNLAGGDAHNKFRDNALVKAMSIEIEMSLIVKYLVSNTRYFGCTNFNKQLYHERVKFEENDRELGRAPDNAPCRALVMGLLNRVADSGNKELKKILGLENVLQKNKLVSDHPLLSYGITNIANNYMHYHADPSSFNSQLRRQVMIKAIIEQYFNQSLNEHLHKVIVRFAKKQNIHLSTHSEIENESTKLPEQHWLTDKASEVLVNQAITPFIQRANQEKKMRWFWGSAGLAFYKNNELITQAKNTRGREETEETLVKKNTIKLNY